MSKAITFFRNRQQGTGHTHELEIQDSARSYRIIIYSRKPLDEALVRTRGGFFKAEVDRITQALRVEGGVIAWTYEHNQERVLAIRPVTPGGKAAFGSFGLLLPGLSSLHLESLSENGVYLPPGSHALVPVDKDAEEALRNFQESITFLPPDLESLVLHAIREPSLDTRMGRVEAALFEGKKAVTWQTGRVGMAGSGFKSWLKRPVQVWPVAAIVLGLMLATNSALLYSVLTVHGSVVLPFQGGDTSSDTEGGTKAATPEQKISAVVDAVRGKNSDPRFNNLLRLHFSKVQKAEDVETVLAQQEDSRLLVRGLLKLEALRLDAGSVPRDFFDANNNLSQVNAFYQGRNLDEKDRKMLAALVCAAFDAPELPATLSVAAVRFAEEDQTCNDFSLKEAASGIDELLKVVQGMN